jgi:hypothetical protein
LSHEVVEGQAKGTARVANLPLLCYICALR